MKVYLSYTRDLEEVADRFAAQLRARDFEPLMDKQHITPGFDWSTAARDLLRSADAFVFFIGRQPTPWVEREWSKVLEESWRRGTVPMVPVVLEGCNPPAFLLERRAIALSPAPENGAEVFDSIVAALSRGPMLKAASSAPAALGEKQRERLELLEKQAKQLQPDRAELQRQAQTLRTTLASQQMQDSPQVAETATQLADLMKSLKQPNEALEFQRIALNSLLAHGGESNPDVARVHSNLATSLEAVGQPSEALVHLERALKIYLDTVGADTVTVAMTEGRLASVLRGLGEDTAAKAHQRAGEKALKAASLKFLTGLPIVGPIIKAVVAQGSKKKHGRSQAPDGKQSASRSRVRKKAARKKAASKKAASKKAASKKAAKKKSAKKAGGTKTRGTKKASKAKVSKTKASKKKVGKKKASAAKAKMTRAKTPSRTPASKAGAKSSGTNVGRKKTASQKRPARKKQPALKAKTSAKRRGRPS